MSILVTGGAGFIGSHTFLVLPQRPSYSLLDCTASRKALDLPPTHWRQALRQLLEAVA